ncbi:ABC transporter ATP-binding protein [Rhizobium sp. SL86]|uniref:ABC transporter ATP-binding protein n=1 Tax=Rhizobium sp. SL86 TaxID=2995148 RepID=UPI002276F58F|nr:ATP-binding cassette domain-containing protein [Rhizobium sp. SL86]MCY1669388.1 ATP-binding cassette domain-containing protein [Rhizobium sp. SL86]
MSVHAEEIPNDSRPLNGPGMPKAETRHAVDTDPRIAIVDLVKRYQTPMGERTVLDKISFTIRPGEKIAVLGQNGAGKSTLVKLVSGVEPPTSGTIHRGMSLSWPVGFSGGFENAMTGHDNIRFIARVYGVPVEKAVAIVDDFAELGRLLHMPMATYSSGMRTRLAFGLTLAVEFDCFLIDEVIAVGDQRFQRKCHDELFVKRKHCAMILVSHDVNTIRNYCNRALVLKSGRGRVFDDLDLALSIYSTL